MARADYHKKTTANSAGHFSSLWVPDGASVIPTTITNQKKSLAKEKEYAKRAKLLTEMQLQFGEVPATSIRYDNVSRRWQGVKGNGADG